MSTDELVAWLRQQIDHDEKVANAAGEICGCHAAALQWTFDRDDEVGGPIVIVGNPHPDMPHKLTRKWGRSYPDTFAAEHITLHDPARVLAEVAVKRLMLDAVARHLDPHPGVLCTNIDADGEPTYEPCELHVAAIGRLDPYVLRLLVLPYADGPGFREEWRPA
jgi:hypothetical protein